MSKSIVWSIPTSAIEEMISMKHKLEGPPEVWGCKFDDTGLQVLIAIEFDDADIDKLLDAGDDYRMLDEGELIQ